MVIVYLNKYIHTSIFIFYSEICTSWKLPAQLLNPSVLKTFYRIRLASWVGVGGVRLGVSGGGGVRGG